MVWPSGGCGSDDSDGEGKKTDGGSDAGDGSADPDAGDAGADVDTYAACSADGWCWEVPKPQGNTLRGAWANGESDIWAVGDHGTALHYDGKGWSSVATGTATTSAQ